MTYKLLSNKTCGFIYSTKSETNGNMFGSVRQFALVRYCILPSAVWCGAVHTFSHTNKTTYNFRFEKLSEARTRLANRKRSSFQLHGFLHLRCICAS